MILSLIFTLALAQDYTANLYEKWPYCETKDGYVLTQGDADRISGLRDGQTYDFVFVQMLRKRIVSQHCKTFQDYIDDKELREHN